MLTAEPQLVPLAAAACADEIMPALQRAQPDVVLLDYHLPGSDGLAVCGMLKQEAAAPAGLLYSAFASGRLAIPAILAGADGVLHKSAPARTCTTPSAWWPAAGGSCRPYRASSSLSPATGFTPRTGRCSAWRSMAAVPR